MTNRKIVAAVLIAFAFGWWASSCLPQFTPTKQRPVMAWIARTARRLLWIAVFADPPPADVDPHTRQAVVGEDGFKVVEHRRGW